MWEAHLAPFQTPILLLLLVRETKKSPDFVTFDESQKD